MKCGTCGREMDPGDRAPGTRIVCEECRGITVVPEPPKRVEEPVAKPGDAVLPYTLPIMAAGTSLGLGAMFAYAAIRLSPGQAGRSRTPGAARRRSGRPGRALPAPLGLRDPAAHDPARRDRGSQRPEVHRLDLFVAGLRGTRADRVLGPDPPHRRRGFLLPRPQAAAILEAAGLIGLLRVVPQL